MKWEKTRIFLALVVVITFLVCWSVIPTEEEQLKASEQMMQPLLLMGWRGSEIITAPIKGTMPTDWSQMVVKRENQVCSFQGVASDKFLTRNGLGQEFGPYDITPVPRTLSERTFRFQSTDNKPVKIIITWETKWRSSLTNQSPRR